MSDPLLAIVDRGPSESLADSWEYARKLLRALLEREAPGIPGEGIQSVEWLWRQNKHWMLPYFDPDGRVRVDVMEDLTDLMACSRYSTALTSLASLIHDLSHRGDYQPISQLLQERMNLSLEESLHRFFSMLPWRFSPLSLISGRVQIRTPVPGDSSGRVFEVGTRMSRVLVHYLHVQTEVAALDWLLEEYPDDEPALDDLVVTLYSQLVSRAKPSPAQVVLSINPLDLLLVSTHTENWRSCHQLIDGQWKTGPLAYLIDRVSAVAYAYRRTEDISLRSWDLPVPEGDPAILPAQPVKLWRQMVFFFPRYQLALQSREYPATMHRFADAVEQLTGNLMRARLKASGEWTSVPNPSLQFIRPRMRLHYPDWPTRALLWGDAQQRRPRWVLVGARQIPCLACGVFRTDGDHHSHVCPDCRQLARRRAWAQPRAV